MQPHGVKKQNFLFIPPWRIRNEWGIKKNHQTQLLLFFLLYPTHSPLQNFPYTQTAEATHPQLVETLNSKQSQTKFSDDFAQMGPWRPGHCVHFPGCCAPFLSRKACSPLKTCYLTMMFSSIRGAVKLCSHIP